MSHPVAACHDSTRAPRRRGDGLSATQAAAAARQPPCRTHRARRLSFLKEQQWALDFGTALVEHRRLCARVRVPAEIVARPGGAADVVAPIDGRLVCGRSNAPGGTSDRRARNWRACSLRHRRQLTCRNSHAGAQQAASPLQLATRDRERAERLVAAGAAPQKRLDEARAAEAQAQARVTGADARLAQFNAPRRRDERTRGCSSCGAPISGVIARRRAAPATTSSAGTVLFRVVDADGVQVAGQVPEATVGARAGGDGRRTRSAGRTNRCSGRAAVALGRVLDPQSRTVPITFRARQRARLASPSARPSSSTALDRSTAPRAGRAGVGHRGRRRAADRLRPA